MGCLHVGERVQFGQFIETLFLGSLSFLYGAGKGRLPYCTGLVVGYLDWQFGGLVAEEILVWRLLGRCTGVKLRLWIDLASSIVFIIVLPSSQGLLVLDFFLWLGV